jgi:hypothetical protein
MARSVTTGRVHHPSAATDNPSTRDEGRSQASSTARRTAGLSAVARATPWGSAPGRRVELLIARSRLVFLGRKDGSGGCSDGRRGWPLLVRKDRAHAARAIAHDDHPAQPHPQILAMFATARRVLRDHRADGRSQRGACWEDERDEGKEGHSGHAGSA